jgi:hypothetical protein
MSRVRNVSPFEPRAGDRREVVRLVRRIQDLVLQLGELRRREAHAAELHAKERELEQLRWRLAAVARRAVPDLDAAA